MPKGLYLSNTKQVIYGMTIFSEWEERVFEVQPNSREKLERILHYSELVNECKE